MKGNLCLLLCIMLAMIHPVDTNGQIITTIAGNGSPGYSGDGTPAPLASLNIPSSIAIDGTGNIYIADALNNCIRKVDHVTGIISTVAGTGSFGYSGDNGPATLAKLGRIWGVAVDAAGNLFIADQNNNRVRKVSTAGIITTIAGGGIDSTGTNGVAATSIHLWRPLGIAVDAGGYIYVGDADAKTIRKISPSGIITTVAGTHFVNGYSGDGGLATFAKFNNIFGIATDLAGNIYVADAENNCIRRIDAAGIINTIAGNGIAGFFGDGGPATSALLNHPTGVIPDGNGNIIVVDALNQRVRKINTTGRIHTIAGTGAGTFNGDGGAAISAGLHDPVYAVVDENETVYVSDGANNRIRRIYKVLFFQNRPSSAIQACEDLSNSIDSVLSAIDHTTGRTVNWSVAQPAPHGTVVASYSAVSIADTIKPVGLSYTPNTGYVGPDTFKIKVNNGVDSDVISIYVNVNPKLTYAGVITGPSGVCVGEMITLSDTFGAGTWTVTNLNAVVSSTGVVTGLSAGEDTVIYTVTNACGSKSATKAITIYPLPDAGIISGASQLCIGSSTLLTESVAGGTWSCSNSNASITATGYITGHAAGKDTVTYEIFNGICTNRTTFVITIVPFPDATITAGKNSICLGETTKLTGAPDGGIWSLGNGNISFADSFITGVNIGTDTLKYIYSNVCGTDTARIIITVNPLPPMPTVTQNGSFIYVPDTYNSYQWLLDNSPIPGARSDSHQVAITGLYAVTVGNSFGCTVTTEQKLYTACTGNDVLIYPNPSESIIYINWCRKTSVKILCMDGKEISINKQATQADLTGLPNGNYMLVIYDEFGNKLKSMKVAKIGR